MLQLLKRNLVPIIFFAFVGTAIFSYMDFATEEQKEIKSIVTYNHNQIKDIKYSISTLNLKSISITDDKQEYEQLNPEFDSLINKISNSKKEIPKQDNADLYKEYFKVSESYYDTIQKAAEESKNLFNLNYNILPFVDEVTNNTTLTNENVSQHIQVYDYLLQSNPSFTKNSQPRRVLNQLKEVETDKVITPEEQQAYTTLRSEQALYVKKILAIVEYTGIDNDKVLKAYDSMKQQEGYLLAQYNLEDWKPD
jgi:hypothetical protein